jgi:hypothetical protein
MLEVLPEQQLAFVVDQLCHEFLSPIDDIAEDKPVELQFQVKNCTSGPYKEDPDIPWTYTATLQKPDGNTFEQRLTNAGNGIYKTQFTPDVTGHWDISVTGMVTLPDGSTHPGFDPRELTVTVYPTTLIQLHIMQPEDGESLNIHIIPKIALIPENIIGKPTKTRIEIQVTDVDENPIPVAKISDDPAQAVQAVISSKEGSTLNQAVPLTISPDNPSKLIAEVEGLTEVGEYQLTATFGNTHREYTPASDNPVQVSFMRVDPLAIVTPISMIIELAIFLFIVFLIVRAIKVRMNPVRGTLEFLDAMGRSLGTIYLTPYKKNTFTIDSKTIRINLDPTVSELIKKLKIKNASTQSSQTHLDDDDDTYGMDTSSDAAILIWGTDVSGEEFLSGDDYPDGMKLLMIDDIYARYRYE